MGGNGQEDIKPGPSDSMRHSQAWQEFHDLVTGPERRRLDSLTHRLDDPVQRAEETSRVLPDALSISVAGSDRIARILQPTIDKTLKASVRKNPKALADAIYPALGPAIRKAIASALMSMIQSLNQMLNQSVSLRGLRWRWEAMRSKKSFGEIVLLHTLVYRVEQLFIIHRKSGLVLQHVAADTTVSRDPDLVSSMLTAIQDFVRDSFDPDTSEQLDTLRMDGDHSVWIEQGTEAILAAVIRGTPPVELRQSFRNLIDELHSKYADLLGNFDGDVTPFAMIKPDLEDALAFQAKEAPARISPLMWCSLLLLLTGMGIWLWSAYQEQRQWQAYVDLLENEPGIVIQEAGKHAGGYCIRGLKDPLAKNPDALLKSAAFARATIHYQWEPYYSLEDKLVLKRALRRLHPPETVNLELENGLLVASGKAPHRWLTTFRQQAVAIPGVRDFRFDRLVDSEWSELKTVLFDLEGRSIYFEQARTQLVQSQLQEMEAILVILQRLQNLQRIIERSVRVAVIGHADPTGPEAINQKLSLERALTVQRWFIQRGIDPLMLIPVGGGVYKSKREEKLPTDLNFNRRVLFQGEGIGG